jgi:cytochrome c biogenesis protein CcmG/thiol:disulfide interchange protein DsbE
MSAVITRTQRRSVLAFAAVVVLMAAVALNAKDQGSLTDGGRAGSDRRLPATEFALFEGGEAAFADFEGKPLVINFWASWCPACVNELPEFQDVHERIGDEVTFIGVANRDPRQASEALAGEVGLTYTLADDPNGDLFRSLDLIAMPSTLFVTPDGEVAEVFAGQLTGQALEARIEQLRGRS